MILIPLAIGIIFTQGSAQLLPSCDSKIYCQGKLLDTIQMATPFNDSKTFVDMKLRHDSATTLENFEDFINKTKTPTPAQIQEFINDNFEDFIEFEDWTPSDFKANPEFIAKIVDEDIKTFSRDVVKIWLDLARKVKNEVFDSPEQFSLIPVENGFIIPGGRFKEFYYWDSYFIVKGLLVSEMFETVKGMLENFLSMVERFGHIPNGARVYYLNRSQPPLLTAMIADYVEATNDTKFLEDNIKTIDAELTFWLDNRLVDVTKNGVIYKVARYDVESGSPRPESYQEDVDSANYFKNEDGKKQLWAELKTGAETGVDYSSRWFGDQNGGNTGNRTFLKTRSIIPVDLNALLCQAFRNLAEFYIILGDIQEATVWYENFVAWQNNIEALFYDEVDGIWYDWDIELSKPRKYFYPTNFAPLWANAYSPKNTENYAKKAVEYLKKNNITEYYGGIPSSLSLTGEQWDFPNAWAPHQHFIIVGLDNSGFCEAKDLAKEFGSRWVRANFIGYNETGLMFEKYDATNPGQMHNGGEYVVQSGFGWTNGVVLDFINKYFTAS